MCERRGLRGEEAVGATTLGGGEGATTPVSVSSLPSFSCSMAPNLRSTDGLPCFLSKGADFLSGGEGRCWGGCPRGELSRWRTGILAAGVMWGS